MACELGHILKESKSCTFKVIIRGRQQVLLFPKLGLSLKILPLATYFLLSKTIFPKWNGILRGGEDVDLAAELREWIEEFINTGIIGQVGFSHQACVHKLFPQFLHPPPRCPLSSTLKFYARGGVSRTSGTAQGLSGGLHQDWEILKTLKCVDIFRTVQLGTRLCSVCLSQIVNLPIPLATYKNAILGLKVELQVPSQALVLLRNTNGGGGWIWRGQSVGG